MQKAAFTMMICALAFVQMPATTSASEGDSMTISDGEHTMNTDHTQRCDGQFALLVTDVPGCDFEDDARSGLGMAIGFLGDSPGEYGTLTGTLTAHLTAASGRELVFSCTWNNGTPAGCDITTNTGWPAIGEGFSFECYSEEGTIGNWGGCVVGH